MARLRKHELDATHKKVAQELVLKHVTGKTEQMIAEECGIERTTIWRLKQKKEFNDYLQKLSDEFIRASLPNAMAKLSMLLDSDNEKTQLKAIELLLKNQGRLKDVVEQEIEVKSEVSIDDIIAEFGLKVD